MQLKENNVFSIKLAYMKKIVKRLTLVSFQCNAFLPSVWYKLAPFFLGSTVTFHIKTKRLIFFTLR